MPLYTFRCEHCSTQVDEQRPVEDRRHPIPCGHCKGLMERVPEMCVIDTFEPYYDEGLGCDVHSRSDRKAEMARLGLVEAERRETQCMVGGTMTRAIPCR